MHKKSIIVELLKGTGFVKEIQLGSPKSSFPYTSV